MHSAPSTTATRSPQLPSFSSARPRRMAAKPAATSSSGRPLPVVPASPRETRKREDGARGDEHRLGDFTGKEFKPGDHRHEGTMDHAGAGHDGAGAIESGE